MGLLGSMVKKDLLRQLRSPLGIIFVLSFPLVFSAMITIVFGSGDNVNMPKVALLVEDRDQSLLSGFLVSSATGEQMAEYFDVTVVGAEGRERMERGEASALLTIPEKFGEDLLAGEPTVLSLVRNPAQSILPEIAEQGLAVLVEVLDAATHALREPLGELESMLDDGEGPDAQQVSEMTVGFYSVINRAEKLILPPVITLESIQLEDEAEVAAAAEDDRPQMEAVFLLVLSGVSVWSLFMLGDVAMRDILTEVRLGTLKRQLCGPLPASQIVYAKALYTAALSLISLLLLVGVASIFSSRGVDAAGFVVLSLALIVAVTGFSAVTYGAAGSEQQGATISNILLLVFAFIGGSFIQIDSLPAAARQFSPLSPFYWGTTGYRELLLGEAGLVDVLPNVGVLVVFGLVLLGIGGSLLGRKIRRAA